MSAAVLREATVLTSNPEQRFCGDSNLQATEMNRFVQGHAVDDRQKSNRLAVWFQVGTGKRFLVGSKQ